LTKAWKFYGQLFITLQDHAEVRQAYLGEYVFVKMRLQGAHLNSQDSLTLCRQLGQDVAFEAPQHQGLQLLVQFLDFLFVIGIVEVELVAQSD
jgi:hypothetical protein